MKARAYYGPRVAGYTVRASDSSGSMGTGDAPGAHWHAAFIRAQGRGATITRTESCPVPGCRDGEIARPGRGRMVRRVPCPAHVPDEDTIEAFDPLVAREHMAEYMPERERRAMAEHNRIPVAMLWPRPCAACPGTIPPSDPPESCLCDACAERTPTDHGWGDAGSMECSP